LSGKNHQFLIMFLQLFLGSGFEQGFYLMGVFFFRFSFCFANTRVSSEGSGHEGLVVESMTSLLAAKASTIEEPRERKAYAGIYAGDAR